MMYRRLLHPIEDAYISQYYANSNFGAAPYLYTNRYQGPGDEYHSLLKFNDDFTCHSGRRIHSQIRLKIYRNEAPCPITLLVYKVLDSWSESNVTWNNRPRIEAPPVGSAVVHPGYFGWVEINLHDHFDHHHGLLIKCDEPFNSLLGFYSREYEDSDYWPQLRVADDRRVRDEAEKPVITITPVAEAVTLSPDLIRVPPYERRRRLVRDRRIDRRCDRR
ncbi:MAG: DNRLRE domain-containing protein, partial [Syntrophomonadaceae bacterium]|nr:DNRLRE domain-containing protein [Syntrophomonadaceae bacterium]